MFKNNIPYFKRGNILKKSMLINLRDFPRDFADFYYNDFSDGIIAGSNIFIDDHFFCVDRGIVKFNGMIYLLEEVSRIRYYNTNKEMVVKIKFSEEREEKDFHCHESSIILDDDLEIKGDELELGRFKLREGARLRSDYSDFMDFATEFNTINIIHVLYANIEKPTLHPFIVKTFARNLFQLSRDDLFDITFAMECLNSRITDRYLLENYLNRKLGLGKDEFSNFEIYKYMRNIIKRLSGIKVVEDRNQKMPRIIVD